MIKFNIDTVKVRSLCIDNNYYTCGDCTAYNNMFTMCENATTPEDIKGIAKDIADHSNVEDDKQEFIDNIVFLILNKCCIYFLSE